MPQQQQGQRNAAAESAAFSNKTAATAIFP